MTTTIELNEKDIAEILAKYFYTSPNNVRVEVRQDIEGYGMMEHFVHNVYATISNVNNKGL